MLRGVALLAGRKGASGLAFECCTARVVGVVQDAFVACARTQQVSEVHFCCCRSMGEHVTFLKLKHNKLFGWFQPKVSTKVYFFKECLFLSLFEKRSVTEQVLSPGPFRVKVFSFFPICIFLLLYLFSITVVMVRVLSVPQKPSTLLNIFFSTQFY